LSAQVSRLEGDLSGARRGAVDAVAFATAAGDSAVVRGACVLAGQVEQAARRWSDAEVWFRRAEAISAEAGGVDHALDLLNLGQLLSQCGRPAEAAQSLQRAQAGSQSAGDPDLAWLVELALGDVAERAGRTETALEHYTLAAGLADTVRVRQGDEGAVAAFAGRTQAHQAIVQLLGRSEQASPGKGAASEAFHWGERAKARSLLDLLAGSGHAERALRPATLAEAQAALPDARTALLAYSVGDSGSALWVVRRDRWQWFALPARAALRARVETVRRAWSTRCSLERTRPACRQRTRARDLGAGAAGTRRYPARHHRAGWSAVVIAVRGIAGATDCGPSGQDGEART
jgi:hypothetical protein